MLVTAFDPNGQKMNEATSARTDIVQAMTQGSDFVLNAFLFQARYARKVLRMPEKLATSVKTKMNATRSGEYPALTAPNARARVAPIAAITLLGEKLFSILLELATPELREPFCDGCLKDELPEAARDLAGRVAPHAAHP